jgi:hypothetical protein
MEFPQGVMREAPADPTRRKDHHMEGCPEARLFSRQLESV